MLRADKQAQTSLSLHVKWIPVRLSVHDATICMMAEAESNHCVQPIPADTVDLLIEYGVQSRDCLYRPSGGQSTIYMLEASTFSKKLRSHNNFSRDHIPSAAQIQHLLMQRSHYMRTGEPECPDTI